MDRPRPSTRARLMPRLLAALALALGAARADAGGDEPIEGRVIAFADDHVRIDAGRDAGLQGGDVGVVVRDGDQIAVVEVLWIDIAYTELRVLSKTDDPRTGDRVVFDRTGREPRTGAAPAAGPLTTGTTAEFVPLLAPPAMRRTALARESGVFHGTLRAREVYQTVSPSNAWYSLSRLDSDGALDRIAGRPWSFQWSANASERTGSAASTADDYRRLQPHAYQLALSRRADGGFDRLGRFFPLELPGLGYVDGGQAERTLAPALRLGAAAGLRPDRINQGFAAREAIGAAYATVDAGERGRASYSGTLGALQTLYRGVRDETALLWDQRAELGPRLSANASLQEDLGSPSALVHKGARLTRLDGGINASPLSWLAVRAGASHFEPIDVAAERDLAGGSTAYLNNGFWRWWGGASQSLPWALSLSEDLSTTRASDSFATTMWRLGIARQGLPGLPSASTSLTAYNLYNPSGRDYGATLATSFPLLGDRLALDASAGARWGPTSDSPRALWLSDFSLHAVWRASRSWAAEAGASRFYQAPIAASTFSGSVSWRW